MKIKQLMDGISPANVLSGFEDIDIGSIASDSRQVTKGTLFIAVRGTSQDGHRYIHDACEKGAAGIVFDDPSFMPTKAPIIPYILVTDSKIAQAKIADTFFGRPFSRIKCVGITGTNGKTTVSYLVRSILNKAGKKCAVIGTIGYSIEKDNTRLSNTTPGVIELRQLAQKMADAGNEYVAMEVSSHALDQERIAGMIFRASIFTNLTQDHLDYHKTMEEYFRAKEKLFKEYAQETTAFVINIDDKFGKRLLGSLGGKKFSYGFSPNADISGRDFELTAKGSRMVVKTMGPELKINTRLVGKHNLCNILAAIAFGISEGIDLPSIKNGIEDVSSVPGRLEKIDSKKGFSVFVDYAHTDDALKNVLESLRIIPHNGRIISVFGCGGDRDKDKRPKMGEVAGRLSDYCIVTSDNPRSEKPQDIIRQIVRGMGKKNFEIVEDRFLAIQKALRLAEANDLVLIAGKGHEDYQIIKDKVCPFSDKAVVLKILKDQEKNV